MMKMRVSLESSHLESSEGVFRMAPPLCHPEPLGNARDKLREGSL
jgi:hypothetical protein